MDRTAQLARIGAALQAAGADADWPRLGEHVHALGDQLRALAALGPWSAAERAALQRLRQSHDAAARHVAGAAHALQERLAVLRTNEEGWLAYAMDGAMSSEPDDGASRNGQ